MGRKSVVVSERGSGTILFSLKEVLISLYLRGDRLIEKQ
jgi:hypothetical protein